MPRPRSPPEEKDDLQRYVINHVKETASAVTSPSNPPTSLLPGEMICEVMDEGSGNAILIDDIVVIHRNCGFLKHCSHQGWKSLYSTEHMAGSGKVSSIEVKICTYNYWLVGSFVCACLLIIALVVRAFEDTLFAVSANTNGTGHAGSHYESHDEISDDPYMS
jgi:hypothetical protein